MSEEAKDTPVGAETEVTVVEPVDIQMYKMYLQHVSIEEIARRFEMTAVNVHKISKKNDWRKKRHRAKEQVYKNLDKRYKEQIVDIVKFIEYDYKLLIQRCMNEKREMYKEERKYVLDLLEQLTKENRLNDGKPTEITDGTSIVRHEVILPPGVLRFGVLPPAKNVIQIESAAAENTEKAPIVEVGADEYLEDD